ncbi:hypothetical protein BEWA_026970 [Theileria equi strain WA]|uniref:Uncharacterized protein n=1 Tax=Theileria equi strain WA TaxID=1537102 RepID=L0AX73_THEEQ|nr:hypothetical protein BEWA_026970 [Theileria equi strain WA]AFZ79848.1 hypothetical protein BEWA_026970 [Theileria equi strain WA]|eukprot:XP_004829514.1 hypothetical protein BEWA_026970 [Theileria equi strain WA]
MSLNGSSGQLSASRDKLVEKYGNTPISDGKMNPQMAMDAFSSKYTHLVANSPLDVLRTELFKPITVSNLEFTDSDYKETEKLEKSIELEVKVCSKSTIFLKKLLENYESTPKSVLSAVLTSKEVISNLLDLHESFTFGLDRELPEEDRILENVKTATKLFNGSCIPLVMWPAQETNSEAMKVPESAIFDAFNIYLLRKHNREVYVEVGRNNPLSHEEGGSLEIDISDATVLRELSDVVIDELLSALWCIVYIGNLYIRKEDVPPMFEAYKEEFVSQDNKLVDKLWSKYLACSDHIKARMPHLKSLDEKFASRVILELNGFVILQNALVTALASLYYLKGEMSASIFNSYASVFILEDFSGVYSCSSELDCDALAVSPILANNVQELQASCVFFLSLFYLMEGDKDGNMLKIHDEFILPILQRWELEDCTKNKALAIPLFLHFALLKNDSSQTLVNGIAAPEFISRSSKFLHKYPESVEWICLSRSIFDSDQFIHARLARYILAESFTRLMESLESPCIPGISKVAYALSTLTRDAFFVDYFADFKILDDLCAFFSLQFPYDIGTFIQLLNALLPLTNGLLKDDSNQVLKNRERIKIVIRTLLRKIDGLNISPLTADLASDGKSYVCNSHTSMELQLIAMFGLDAGTFAENWSKWELGDCLYFLPKGSCGMLTELDVHDQLKDVAPGKYWIRNSELGLVLADEAPSVHISCIRFNLEDTLRISYGNETISHEKGAEFTILRSLWVIWKSCIVHLANTPYELDDVALQTFVSCNSLFSRLLVNFPCLFYLMESHLSSTLYVKEDDSPLGHCSFAYHFTLILVLALRRPRLRVVLPDTIAALSSFLVPNYVVPLEENTTEAEFHRYWMFFYSLEHIQTKYSTDNNFNIFLLLSRVMQEEEKLLKVYPVTCAILGFFRDLLKVCPPELWILHSVHHGLWNISHSSLTAQSRDVFMGISCSHLRSLKSRLEHRAGSIYSSFQTFFFCEMVSFALKSVGTNICELEFSDANQRLEMILAVLDIALLTSRLFKVCNYNVEGGGVPTGTCNNSDEWIKGLDELGNQVLMVFSESNYISELIRIISCQMNILKGKEGASLVMLNPLVFSEVSLSFFTPRLQNMRKIAPLFFMLESADKIGQECKINARYRWLSQHFSSCDGTSHGKRIVERALELVHQLQIIALPKNKSFIFGTLARTLGGEFFCMSKLSSQTPFLSISSSVYSENDPISYYLQVQLGAMRSILPQAPLAQSIISHAYGGYNLALSTDILTLYMLLNEFYDKKTHYPGDKNHLLDQLGLTKGTDALLFIANKEEESFVEHLICTFFDTRLCGYDECISILRYFVACLETNIGAEFLKSEGVSVGFNVLTSFIDSVLRLHILNGMTISQVSLGNITVVQLALVVFSRLVVVCMDPKVKGTRLCWETVDLVLRTLVDFLGVFDSFKNLFSEIKLEVLPMLDYRRGLDSTLDLSIPLSRGEAVLEKKVAVVEIIGSIYSILSAVSLYLPMERHDDHFLKIVEYVSTSWDFVETLFPTCSYDNGCFTRTGDNSSIDCNDKETRLGLWLGDDLLNWLPRLLDFASKMNVPVENILLKSPVHDICAFDFSLLKEDSQVNGFKMQDMLSLMMRHISGVPELNFVSRLSQGRTFVDTGAENRTVWEFLNFGTAENYGLFYLTNVCRFSCISTILMCKNGYGTNVYDLENVKNCIKMVSLVESMNASKLKTMTVLFDIVKFTRENPTALKVTKPFETFAINLTMTAQLGLASPSICNENSLYLGILIKLLATIVDGADVKGLIQSFDQHYSESGQYSRDDVETFIINVFGGFIAQLVQFVSTNLAAFDKVPDLLFGKESGYKFHKRFFVNSRRAVNGELALDEELVWMQYIILHSFPALYRQFSGIVNKVQKTNSQVETLYRNVAKHVITSLSRVSHHLLTLCCRWERQIVKILSQFSQPGNGYLCAEIFVSIFAPVVATLALKEVVATPLNKDQGHDFLFLLSDILISHKFTSCVPMPPSLMESLLNSEHLESNKKYLLENFKNKAELRYENCNLVCAMVVKCLDHLLSMFIFALKHESAEHSLSQLIIKSHMIQKIYMYPFANYFVQPINSITPKSALESYLGPERYGCKDKRAVVQGNCIEVLESSINTWYPYYIQDKNNVQSRCNLHLLHCKILYFVSLLNVDGSESVHILMLLQTLEKRAKHVLTGGVVSVAQLEEALLYFSLLRKLPPRLSLSHANLKTISKFLKWSAVHFDNLADVIHGKGNRAGSVKARTKHQSLLYLILENAMTFTSLLLDLKVTLDLQDELPPTADKFLTYGQDSQDAVGLTREQFVSSIAAGSFTGCRGTPLGPSSISLDLVLAIFRIVVDLGSMGLSVLDDFTKAPILYGYKNGDQILLPMADHFSEPVSHDKTPVETLTIEKCGHFLVQVDPMGKSSAKNHSILPAAIELGDLQKIAEVIVEKSLLFGSQFINTLCLQNSLNNQGRRDLFSPNSFTLLSALCSDVAAHKDVTSQSLQEFNSVISDYISKKKLDAKNIHSTFGDTIIFLK